MDRKCPPLWYKGVSKLTPLSSKVFQLPMYLGFYANMRCLLKLVLHSRVSKSLRTPPWDTVALRWKIFNKDPMIGRYNLSIK